MYMGVMRCPALPSRSQCQHRSDPKDITVISSHKTLKKETNCPSIKES